MTTVDEKIRALEAEAAAEAAAPPAKVGFCTFTVLMRCSACGGGLPLMGPMRTVHCAACQTNNSFDAKQVADLIARASTRLEYLDMDAKLGHFDAQPCSKCNAPVDIAHGERSCKACGTAVTSFEPPAWLAAELPALVKIYGAERDAADVTADGVVLPAPQVAAPVVTRCPECGGSLRVSSESERNVTCEHCNVRVFLPDELWRSLHPVKRVTPWSVEWNGPHGLETLTTIGYRKNAERAKKETEEARRKDEAEYKAKRQREENERAFREAERDAERAQSEAAKDRQGWIVYGIVFVILGILGLAYVASQHH
jgi:hypothetical protein